MQPHIRTRLRTLALGAALFALPAGALAQSASKQAAAQALFEDAKKRMLQGDIAAACQRFYDSQQLDPAPGTEFNLANCYEKAGKTASAWATFKSAAAAYGAHGRADWEQKARDRATALEPALSKLAIAVPAESNVPGLEVRRDGQVVAASELDAGIPVDPGEHVVEAHAPGKKAWRTAVTVAASAPVLRVTVGPLADDVAPAAPIPAAPSPPQGAAPAPHGDARPAQPPPSASIQRPLGWAALGVGAVGLGVGTVTGVMAMSKNKSSLDACPSDGPCANKDAVDANGSAKTLGTISTIGFVVGGVGVAAGAVLLATAPRASAQIGSLRIVPSPMLGGAGLTAAGAFQ